MVLPDRAADLEVAPDGVLREDLLNPSVHLPGRPQPRLRTGEPDPQRAERLKGRGEPLPPALLLAQRAQRAPHPDHRPRLPRGERRPVDVPPVTGTALAAGFGRSQISSQGDSWVWTHFRNSRSSSCERNPREQGDRRAPDLRAVAAGHRSRARRPWHHGQQRAAVRGADTRPKARLVVMVDHLGMGGVAVDHEVAVRRVGEEAGRCRFDGSSRARHVAVPYGSQLSHVGVGDLAADGACGVDLTRVGSSNLHPLARERRKAAAFPVHVVQVDGGSELTGDFEQEC